MKSSRYFLTEEREVTKEEYVRAERKAGFHNTMGQPNEPATASFSDGKVSGRMEEGTEVLDNHAAYVESLHQY